MFIGTATTPTIYHQFTINSMNCWHRKSKWINNIFAVTFLCLLIRTLSLCATQKYLQICCIYLEAHTKCHLNIVWNPFNLSDMEKDIQHKSNRKKQIILDTILSIARIHLALFYSIDLSIEWIE